MIERLLPDVIACAETREDTLDVELFPEEGASLGRAVDKRRREFVAGRACARIALGRLGIAPVAIPNGPRGEPLWPPGIVGSITHCAGYRACAAARSADVASVGINAEPIGPLPAGVLKEVASDRERAFIASARAGDGELDLGRLIFSAKEAVYKAWFPLTQRWLGFMDAELSLDLADATFHAHLLVPGPLVRGETVTEFRGRWTVDDGIACTAVLIA